MSKYYATHAWHYSIVVRLLGQSSCSSPFTKELHGLPDESWLDQETLCCFAEPLEEEVGAGVVLPTVAFVLQLLSKLLKSGSSSSWMKLLSKSLCARHLL